MKDFLKIFTGLILLVTAFTVGKDHGVKSITETTEYKQQLVAQALVMQKDEQLQKIKSEFQKLLDSTDLKQGHELLSKMVVVLLADLALKISKDQEDQIAVGKNYCMAGYVAQSPISKAVAEAAGKPELAAPQVIATRNVRPGWASMKPPQFKSYEWLGMNAGTERNSLRQLARTEIKNMNEFIGQAQVADAGKYSVFEGEYKGTIQDINNQTYAMLTTKINVLTLHGKPKVTFNTVMIRNGEESRKSATGNDFGWYNPDVYAMVIEQSKDRYLQIYKLNTTKKLAGNYYEVLPNGTTKLIGQFALTRIDRF